MDPRRGLERLAQPLAGEPLGRERAQLVVDQRQELLGRLRVALLDIQEDAAHVRHRQARRRATRALSTEPGPSDGARQTIARSGRGDTEARIQIIHRSLAVIASESEAAASRRPPPRFGSPTTKV